MKGLRKLFDVVESKVRGLRALGVPSSSYGGLLSSVLIGKLPAELRLIISRELNEAEWDLESMMRILEREVEARERSAGALPSRNPVTKSPHTALSLMTGASIQVSCVYCSQPHSSTSCRTVTDLEERKCLLRTGGRCYVCLKRHHISRNCRSSTRCSHCRGRHHTSICSGSNSRAERGSPLDNRSAGNSLTHWWSDPNSNDVFHVHELPHTYPSTNSKGHFVSTRTYP